MNRCPSGSCAGWGQQIGPTPPWRNSMWRRNPKTASLVYFVKHIYRILIRSRHLTRFSCKLISARGSDNLWNLDRSVSSSEYKTEWACRFGLFCSLHLFVALSEGCPFQIMSLHPSCSWSVSMVLIKGSRVRPLTPRTHAPVRPSVRPSPAPSSQTI